MKKVFLFAVLLTAFVWTSDAQFIKFGVKAGANFANLAGEDVENSNVRTSFHAGGMVEFILSDKFSFQPELLYSSQGANQDYGDDGEAQLKLDYLNLPLMGKYYVTEGFSVQVGPQIGFLLAANGEVPGEDIEVDVKDQTKNIDFGVNLGLGYKLSSGLFFDARYNLGLTDISDVDNVVEGRNSVIQVSVGYSF